MKKVYCIRLVNKIYMTVNINKVQMGMLNKTVEAIKKQIVFHKQQK